MPRLMSFFLTTPQFLNKTKTVTRRNGWEFLQNGDIVQGVEKGQGIPKGGKVNRLGMIKAIDPRRERLDKMLTDIPYGLAEVIAEGFPDMTPDQFVAMYCKHNKCDPDHIITRIQYDYLTDEAAP